MLYNVRKQNLKWKRIEGDVMEKLNVAVVFGGYSNEHEVSIGSGKTVIDGLDKEKYNVLPIYIDTDGNWFLADGDISYDMATEGLNKVLVSPSRGDRSLFILESEGYKKLQIDFVFPALLGKYGEDGTIQGLFEIMGVPYSGCGVLASSMSMDKVFANDIARLINMPQPDYMSYKEGDTIDYNEIINRLGLPCFVKPVRSGSSVGIVKPETEEELKEAIITAFKYDNKIIIEKNIIGRELKCAVLGSGGDDTIASYCGETIFENDLGFYDYEAKYKSSTTRKVIPAEVPDEVHQKVKELALQIFKALDCSGLARADFFIEDGTGDILFNEINTFPAFTEVSMYPALCKHVGYPLPKLLDKLIEIGQKAAR